MLEIIFQKHVGLWVLELKRAMKNITCEYMNIKVFSPAVEAWAVSAVQICSEKEKKYEYV